MAKEIFISYCRKDFDKVKAIKDEIFRELGIDCWMDLDGIESGQQFEDVIISAIRDHDTLLFMLSPNSMSSEWALDELGFAKKIGKRIVLLYIESCEMSDKFYLRYNKYQTIDWNNSLQHNKLMQNFGEWFPKEERDAEVQYKMGCDYFYGGNFIEASKWFLKAANQGHVLAQSCMGWLYEHGEGFLLDYEEAFRWYKKAAEKGEVKSQNRLGYFYSCGKGVKQDYIQSAYWYRKAAEQGDANAKEMLNRLKERGVL